MPSTSTAKITITLTSEEFRNLRSELELLLQEFQGQLKNSPSSSEFHNIQGRRIQLAALLSNRF